MYLAIFLQVIISFQVYSPPPHCVNLLQWILWILIWLNIDTDYFIYYNLKVFSFSYPVLYRICCLFNAFSLFHYFPSPPLKCVSFFLHHFAALLSNRQASFHCDLSFLLCLQVWNINCAIEFLSINSAFEYKPTSKISTLSETIWLHILGQNCIFSVPTHWHKNYYKNINLQHYIILPMTVFATSKFSRKKGNFAWGQSVHTVCVSSLCYLQTLKSSVSLQINVHTIQNSQMKPKHNIRTVWWMSEAKEQKLLFTSTQHSLNPLMRKSTQYNIRWSQVKFMI